MIVQYTAEQIVRLSNNLKKSQVLLVIHRGGGIFTDITITTGYFYCKSGYIAINDSINLEKLYKICVEEGRN